MNVRPIFFHNRKELAFPLAFLLSCLFHTFAIPYVFNVLFLAVFTAVFLHLLPNCLADLGIFNVVHWSAVHFYLPTPLSELFDTC